MLAYSIELQIGPRRHHLLTPSIFRAKLEHVVDMFTTVKLLRMQRPQMVESREQYEFCYRAVIEFLTSWEENY